MTGQPYCASHANTHSGRRPAGKLVLSADIDFTISENPNVRFFFVPKEAGQLTVNVIDSNDAKFEKSLAVAPGQRSDA